MVLAYLNQKILTIILYVNLTIKRKMNKRKPIQPKIKLQVFKRDNYRCRSCGTSPAFNLEVSLEVDHIQPFSKGGSNDISNLQTLCMKCNRGKGNNAELNKTILNDFCNRLDKINPEILKKLELSNDFISVVSNSEDFIPLKNLNDCLEQKFIIEPTNNTIIGYNAGKNLGIYTIVDNYGQKANFKIKKTGN